MLPLLHQSWQWNFVFWAVPVILIAALIFGLAPPAHAAASTPAARRWMPDFGDPKLWRIGLLLGSVYQRFSRSLTYLPTTNAAG